MSVFMHVTAEIEIPRRRTVIAAICAGRDAAGIGAGVSSRVQPHDGPPGQLALQGRDDLADSLGSAGAGDRKSVV